MQPIGIIGGAGPLAGIFLLEKVVRLAIGQYGCYRDADFPRIILLSYPFSDMLSRSITADKVRDELKEALKQLRQQGAHVLAIACNTLHLFLDSEETGVVHLLKAEKFETEPLVLCTSTSRHAQLHREFFPCRYPSNAIQTQIDDLIEQILRGRERKIILKALLKIIKKEKVFLGCTELSLFTEELRAAGCFVIDPLERTAAEIIKRSFANVC